MAKKTGRHSLLPGFHAPATGFSLIELLVVVAIIGALVALLLPAVQASRETARRSGCANNLKQIGLALHLYHDVHKSFPPGGIEWRPWGNAANRQLAWSAFVLPYLEEQPLYDRLDLKQPFDSPANAEAAATVLPVYICPSSARGARLVQGRGPADYGGIYGERITSPNNPPKGVMIYDRAFATHQIDDGLTHTLMIAEDSQFGDGQWINGRNVFDQAYAINAAPPFENDIRSEHTAGAMSLLASGSVRFLDESIDLRSLAALCTREGREVIDHLW
ncbi:MAG: DUF1559 domain-containing protein [Planctomycetales bacterium]|nr:DUF1559 domain-containing protein [Planctomycetales bacterium]